MKVLVAVDDSPYSRAAIDWVKRFPFRGAEVIVLSASADVWAGPGQEHGTDPVAELNRQQEEWHREIAEKAAAELREENGLSVRSLALRDDPRDAIVETARRERADLVVVGSHGRSGLRAALLGSVASHVVAHAPCSVLVVRGT